MNMSSISYILIFLFSVADPHTLPLDKETLELPEGTTSQLDYPKIMSDFLQFQRGEADIFFPGSEFQG